MLPKHIQPIAKKIIPILKKNGVVKAGIVGSYARNEQKKKSDLDILIKFNGSLLDMVGIQQELKKKLGIKIDIVSYKGISPYLKKRILKEEGRIYERTNNLRKPHKRRNSSN